MSNYILPKSSHYLIQENMWMAAQALVCCEASCIVFLNDYE